MSEVISKMVKKIVDKQLVSEPINYDKLIKELEKLKQKLKSDVVNCVD
jgi:hypothetical protein